MPAAKTEVPWLGFIWATRNVEARHTIFFGMSRIPIWDGFVIEFSWIWALFLILFETVLTFATVPFLGCILYNVSSLFCFLATLMHLQTYSTA